MYINVFRTFWSRLEFMWPQLEAVEADSRQSRFLKQFCHKMSILSLASCQIVADTKRSTTKIGKYLLLWFIYVIPFVNRSTSGNGDFNSGLFIIIFR